MLRIYSDQNIRRSEGLRVVVTAPSFTAFELPGSGTIRSLSALQADKMSVSISGSGDVILDQGRYEAFDGRVAGSGTIRVGGSAGSMNVAIVGSGDFLGSNFTATTAEASISGSGNVQCSVVETLRASVSGSGDVQYSGNPRVESKVSGSGSVQRTSDAVMETGTPDDPE